MNASTVLGRITRRLVDDALAIIAPALCPSCGSPLRDDEGSYCDGCRASLEPAPFPRELLEELLGVFTGDELALSSIGSLYTFQKGGPVQSLLHAVKYRGCFRLGVDLGRDLGHALRQFREFAEVELVVPVPLHRTRLRERGYNQAEAIARGISASVGVPTETNAVVRVRHTGTQTALSAAARKANVRTAFAGVADAIRGRIVLLCDDVLTTGSTLNACAEALLNAGALSVCAATVAKDPLAAAGPSNQRTW
jgi:ComF family protein